MITNIDNKKFPTPYIFYRDYANDFPKQATVNRTILDQSLRVAQVALPFITLYKPLSQPLAVGLGATRAILSIAQMVDAMDAGDISRTAKRAFEVAIASTALACSILVHPLGMLVTTAHDMILNITQLAKAISEQNYKAAGEIGLHLTNSALYLGCICTGSLELSLSLIGMQAFSGLYSACKEFRDGNYLEGCGHALMAWIRGNQAYDYVQILKLQNESLRELSPIFQEARERDAIIEELKLNELLGERNYIITKTETGYLLQTEVGVVRIDVTYLVSDRPGSKDFEFVLHDFEEMNFDQFTKAACTSPCPTLFMMPEQNIMQNKQLANQFQSGTVQKAPMETLFPAKTILI